MERNPVAVSLGVVVLAAVAWLAFRPTGLRVGSLRVVPPSPGACVGRVEATVVNGTWEAIQVGGLTVREDGKDWRSQYFCIFPLKEGGPEFAWFATGSPVFGGGITLEPGASCVLARAMVRLRGGAAKRFSIHGEIYTDLGTLTTPPVDIEPAAWPLPVTMGPEALDRALREGHELTIAVESAALPGGGAFALEIGPGGRARGRGRGQLPGRAEGAHDFQASGALTPEQQKGLRAAVRTAPLAAFLADPENLYVECGSPVRLLIAAGPAVFAGCSQRGDFVAGGLDPLLEHLRLLLRDLPEAEGGR